MPGSGRFARPAASVQKKEDDMRERKTRLLVCLGCFLAMACILISSDSGRVFAQAAPSAPPPGERTPKGPDRQRELREKTLRGIEMSPGLGNPNNQQVILAALDKVKEDFRRIQVVRNELVRALKSEKPFDYDVVTEEVSEINQRAERLKTYLIPVNPVDKAAPKDPVEMNESEVKVGLIKLCNLVYAFVENPTFKNLEVTDPTQSARATSDLLSIVDLSSRIKSCTQKLGKASK
jgi:hypothetical protein